MLSKSMIAAAAAFSLFASTSALYDPNAKTNLVMYWGQGPNQLVLSDFCKNTPADIIPIGFINDFSPAANGLVGQNFGNACWGDPKYKGPGYNGKYTAGNDLLPQRCPTVQDSIPKCQALGKKILLSIGGAVNTWNPKTNKMDKTYVNQLKSAADGEFMATFLWKAYGPYDPAYTGVRPLDRGSNNVTANLRIDIDGFDFDIEGSAAGTNRLNGETAAYIAMIKKLRTYMNAQQAKTGKKYLITGAPQCTFNSVGKEANMDAVIYQAGFDILWIQFYNQGLPSCTARSRANKVGAFNWVNWVNYIAQKGSGSNGAMLYIGLLGGPSGSSGSPGDYLKVAEVQNLIATYGKQPKFGGVMLWDATAAYTNRAADLPAGQKYWNVVKNAMLKNYPPKTARHIEAHVHSHQHAHKH